MDSSKFDLRRMNSSAITSTTPLELGYGLAPFLDSIIMAMPQNDHSVELRLRSIVNILVISKLQSDRDRTELDDAKNLITSRQDDILAAKPQIFGKCSIINLDRWTILSITGAEKMNTAKLCDDISEAVDKGFLGKHFILDLSQIGRLDLKLSAYLIGLQRMVSQRGRQMSIAWLPRTAVAEISKNTHDSLISKFNLYKKGSFLLSSAAI